MGRERKRGTQKANLIEFLNKILENEYNRNWQQLLVKNCQEVTGRKCLISDFTFV